MRKSFYLPFYVERLPVAEKLCKASTKDNSRATLYPLKAKTLQRWPTVQRSKFYSSHNQCLSNSLVAHSNK